MNRIYRIFNSCQKCFEKYQGQPKKLQDLSFTGQINKKIYIYYK